MTNAFWGADKCFQGKRFIGKFFFNMGHTMAISESDRNPMSKANYFLQRKMFLYCGRSVGYSLGKTSVRQGSRQDRRQGRRTDGVRNKWIASIGQTAQTNDTGPRYDYLNIGARKTSLRPEQMSVLDKTGLYLPTGDKAIGRVEGTSMIAAFQKKNTPFTLSQVSHCVPIHFNHKYPLCPHPSHHHRHQPASQTHMPYLPYAPHSLLHGLHPSCSCHLFTRVYILLPFLILY